MIKIAVCDDEKNIRTYLLSLLQKQEIACDITEYASGNEYLSDGRKFDLVFLDIGMEQANLGINGMTVARKIRNTNYMKQPLIIFVTGYMEYVYEAFDVGAFHYLTKPVNEQKFAEVFGRAVRQICRSTEEKGKELSLMVQFAGRRKVIPWNNLYYIESRNHKVVLHLKAEQLTYYARMGDLEEELRGQFFRIHKGYIINLSYIDEYDKTEVTLINGEKLLISKYKYQKFVQAYLNYMEK